MSSELAVFDLDTGDTRVLFATDALIEAPNWSPDDRFLVVNGDGLLYRLALDAPERGLERIDTGFADACNNDHGISPDGTTLAISHNDGDGSCIHILPIGGGTPRRVTPKTPSWWHGWTPDGRTLLYTARRDGVFDIHAIDVDGGEERRLTSGPGHKDGPDVTPDGEWIWFNADPDGRMKLHRVRLDGSGLERMSDGDTVDWFPHPSPDGRYVLYLAYPPGTEGHPRGRDVELRLIPAGGGGPETLLRLHGGQGTINVPCWSPDGRRFAFVRYGR